MTRTRARQARRASRPRSSETSRVKLRMISAKASSSSAAQVARPVPLVRQVVLLDITVCLATAAIGTHGRASRR